MQIKVTKDINNKSIIVEYLNTDHFKSLSTIFNNYKKGFYCISLEKKTIRTIPSQWTKITDCGNNMYFTFKNCSYNNIYVDVTSAKYDHRFFFHLNNGDKNRFIVHALPGMNMDESFNYIKKFFEILSLLDHGKFKDE